VRQFTRRSADTSRAGARAAGLLAQALAPRHVCLSAAIADPLTGARASRIAIAARPDEAALLDLVDASRP